ncbi:MAG: hypothetical protein U0457_02300 [Candidatus Sericytochromatia bacterium]
MVAINRQSHVAVTERPRVTTPSNTPAHSQPAQQTQAHQNHPPVQNRANTVNVNRTASQDDGHAARSFSFPSQQRVTATTSLGQRIASVQSNNQAHNATHVVAHHGAAHGHSALETVNHAAHSVASRFEQSAIPSTVRSGVRALSESRVGNAVRTGSRVLAESRVGNTIGRVTRAANVAERATEIGGNLLVRAASTRVGALGAGALRVAGRANTLIHIAHGSSAGTQARIFRGAASLAERAGLSRVASGATRLATTAAHEAHHAGALAREFGGVAGATRTARVAARVLPGAARVASTLGRIAPGVGFVAGVTGAALAVNEARHARTTAGRNVAYVRAGLNVVAAGASLVPGVGTAVGLAATGIDLGLSWYAKRSGWN